MWTDKCPPKLIVEFHDAITRIACLLCEQPERQEANYYQQVTARANDKTPLLQSNHVGLVFALAARRKGVGGFHGGPAKHFNGKVFCSCDNSSAPPRMSRNDIQHSVR
jgi:hypothetical protein